MFQSLAVKAAGIDKTLHDFVSAEKVKAEKLLEGVNKRLKKAEEKKHETGINQVLALKNKLFPEGGLQERHDNILNFYLNSPGLLPAMQQPDPFDFRFQLFIENGAE